LIVIVLGCMFCVSAFIGTQDRKLIWDNKKIPVSNGDFSMINGG
jgi:hypothetical protein